MASKAETAIVVFQKHLGSEEGVGEWFAIDQERINAFADATLDHQFIHVDPEKSAQLSPYKVTIAHGFLTLSMIVHLGGQIPGERSLQRTELADFRVPPDRTWLDTAVMSGPISTIDVWDTYQIEGWG